MSNLPNWKIRSTVRILFDFNIDLEINFTTMIKYLNEKKLFGRWAFNEIRESKKVGIEHRCSDNDRWMSFYSDRDYSRNAPPHNGHILNNAGTESIAIGFRMLLGFIGKFVIFLFSVDEWEELVYRLEKVASKYDTNW